MQKSSAAPAFGHFSPPAAMAWIPAVTQHCRPSWPGHLLAHSLRRLFIMASGAKIVDATVEGLKLRFYLQDNVSERRYFFTPKFFDPREHDFIRKFLPPDGIFVDVGANVGIYSLWAAQSSSPAGQVIAIEPNPSALARLSFNIACNNFEKRIHVVPLGISEKSGHFQLYLETSNLGESSLRRRDGAQAGRTITVACAPLAAILTEQQVERVDIMKLDIEGVEEVVLKAFFTQALPTLFPRAIIIEKAEPPRAVVLDSLLLDNGYGLEQTTKMNLIYCQLPLQCS